MKKHKPVKSAVPAGELRTEIALLTFLADDKSRDLALAYLKAYFMEYSSFSDSVNISIQSLSINENPKGLINRLIRLKPSIIGFSCYVWSIDEILILAGQLKRALPDLKIVLGGPEVSAKAEAILRAEKAIDVVVVNEGEKTFKELIEHWLRGENNLAIIKGISFRRNGVVLNTPRRGLIKPLDSIPSPYLSAVIIPDDKNACLETARGCIFNCRYCYYNKQTACLRLFPLRRVKKELKLLLKRNVRTIYLIDPTFNLDKKRALEILRFFSRHKKDSRLHLEIKAELLDAELVGAIAAAGVELLEIGLQTVNKEALDNIKRKFEPGLFKDNIRLLNERKIKYSVQLIEGLPGDSYESFKGSLDWAFDLKPYNIEIFRLMVLPGTYLAQNPEDFELKFESRPPYFVKRSYSFDEAEVKKMGDLKTAALFLYQNLFSPDILAEIAYSLQISFSQICEHWRGWLSLEHKDIFDIYKLEFPDKPLVGNCLFNIKLAELAREFIIFLFKNRSASIPVYLLNDVDKYNKKSLEELGIVKEKISTCVN